jgi:hypothetical protein
MMVSGHNRIMKKNGTWLVALSLLLVGVSSTGFGRSMEEERAFVQDCRKLGARTVSEPKIADYGLITGGASKQVVCVYDMSCVSPKYNVNERNAYFCLYQPKVGCEDFDSCIENLPDPKRQFNLRPAYKSDNAKGDSCGDPIGKRYVRPEKASDTEIPEPVCIQTPSCNGKAAPLAACRSTGKTGPIEVSGKTYQVPICPTTDECISDKYAVSLFSPQEYDARVVAADKARVDSTRPKGSEKSAQIPSNHSNRRP